MRTSFPHRRFSGTCVTIAFRARHPAGFVWSQNGTRFAYAERNALRKEEPSGGSYYASDQFSRARCDQRHILGERGSLEFGRVSTASLVSRVIPWPSILLNKGNEAEMAHVPHSNRNLRRLEKQARMLFHALRRGDATAIRRFYSTDPLAGALEPRLSEAQYIIAREGGFVSWRQLVGRLQS
jgi:hypothetical protein